ncbi:hypothetical protein, partial [Roseibium sp. RKSG952]|uniref:hypothetical protein n=1 Tax=Roseibium sp. RKSG952 TaxID=2529384 RepID=UPI0018AD20FB
VLSDLTLELDPDGIGGKDGDVLRMSWAKNGKSGYVEFADEGRHIERFEFADGTAYEADDFNFV